MFLNITRTKSASTPNQVYMVPLPDFTLYPEGIDDKRKGCWMIFLKFLKLLIWPHGHVIKEEKKMSPFLRMILNENSAEIYDNPSIAAIIDFKWNLARGYYFRQILLYFIFAVNFALIVRAIDGTDADSIFDSMEKNKIKSGEYSNLDLLFVFHRIYGIGKPITLHWIGGYLLNTERIQLKYVGWKRYFNFYNFFDLFSVILPLIVISIHPFGLDRDDINDMASLIIYTSFTSFTILVISFELVLLLRYFEKTGAYIYIITNIVKQIIPFLLFILLFTFGIGFSMYVLLRSDSTKDYYSTLPKSIEAVYFWTNGRWDQLDLNDWSVDFFTLIGSILLVIILQNMLIAIMASAFDDAKEVSRHAVLKFRAEMIADYETTEKLFGNKEENPRYIYFSARSDYIERWLKKSEKARDCHKNFSTEGDNGNLCYYGNDVNDDNNSDNDDDSGDDRNLINSLLQDLSFNTSQNKEREIPLSSSYWFIDEDSNIPQRREREIPLSSCWFVDEDEDKSRTLLITSKIQSNNNQVLQNKIDHLIHLLHNHQNTCCSVVR
ncbi:hypothetical protein RclHR1_15440001 [Rhizophagus clarus]|uniref:Ion transport domain-containing protein n=1 Tax=Rhizophagus clarus TaxID=94130 RepID=A0A2Z6QFB0_9GLOM|nr:hypothetical protein RclHR1_15440001 [Rhizophagus clarus]